MKLRASVPTEAFRQVHNDEPSWVILLGYKSAVMCERLVLRAGDAAGIHGASVSQAVPPILHASMSKRTIAIGDIHGCFPALDALLRAICPTQQDVVITLGDYTSRGDQSCRVLDRLVKLGQECQLVPVLGNHDEMMLEARNGTVEKSRWIDSGGFETMMSYGPDLDLKVIPEAHWQFLKSCVPYFETDEHFFVHANYDHRLPLNQQDEWMLRWMALDDAFPRPHCSGKCAVLGHTPQMTGNILDGPYLKAIDTGCGFGGRLTAFDVGTGQTWQVAENGTAVS